MILHWTQKKHDLVLQWVGPNRITNVAVTSIEEVMPKLAVIAGPAGSEGPQGPAGLPGDGSATFVWSPPEAMVSWVIPHNQNKYPAVTVVDSTGSVLYGEVTYLDSNLVEIAFAFPVSGTAYLN